MFYYTSDSSIFHSKVKAYAYAKANGQKLWYYYYDSMYTKLNWSIEPKESLQELYKQQAIRLREKFDYLVLCYSGGYDSTNILETFYYNGIKLDKIITVGALSQDSGFGDDTNRNGELYHNVFPTIDRLGLSSITEVIDHTKYFDNLSILEYGSDWTDVLGTRFSPYQWVWRDIERIVLPTNLGSKKAGIIFGRDKPSIDNDGVFRFNDNILTAYGNICSTINSERINFYWDPTYTDILLKQVHVLKRVKKLKCIYDVNALMYKLINPLVFKSPKSPSYVLSGRDTYLTNKKSSQIYSRLLGAISSLDVGGGSGVNSRGYKIE